LGVIEHASPQVFADKANAIAAPLHIDACGAWCLHQLLA
jgi:hypothetical protein